MADSQWRPSPSGQFYDVCSHNGCKKKAWHNDGHLCCGKPYHDLAHELTAQRRADREAGIVYREPSAREEALWFTAFLGLIAAAGVIVDRFWGGGRDR